MNKLKELKNKIENIEVTYDYEETYNNLYNTCIDYMNETQDWFLEEIFDDIISYETAEEIAKVELEKGGLIRLYYFLGNANLERDMFRINGYGNLEDLTFNDLEDLKEEILDRIDERKEV